MIKEYLESRQSVLTEAIAINKEIYKQGQIKIFEIEKKIDEVVSKDDDAEKIFSVRTRENNGKKSEEILELEAQIDEIANKNKEIKEIYEKNEKELGIVRSCLENVSRETFSGEVNRKTNESYHATSAQPNGGKKEIETGSTYTHQEFQMENNHKERVTETNNENKTENVSRETLNKQKERIIKKLEFCKRIICSDAKRVYIELEELIKQINN